MENNGHYDRRTFLGTLAAAGVVITAGPILSACSTPNDSGSGAGKSATALGPGKSTIPTEPFTGPTKGGEKPNLPRRAAGAMNSLSNPAFASMAAAMKLACKDRGVEYLQAAASGDPQLNIQQMNAFLAKGVGGIFVWDADTEAQRPVTRKFMEAGAATFTLSNGPAFTPIVADEIKLGETMGRPAVDWISKELNGKAEVLLFNLDNQVGTRPHTQKIRDLLKAVPGARIVADVTWDVNDPNFGFTTMNSVLQAHPNVKVVLGDDPVVASALSAVEAAGKVSGDMFFLGVGGSDLAMDKIIKGTPYRATVSTAWPVMGYACGQWSVDWMDGLTVPSLAEIGFPILNSEESINKFKADMAKPGETFQTNLARYFSAWGSISYATRQNYWNSKTPGKDLATRAGG